MNEDGASKDALSRLTQLERENRKLRRENTYLNHAIAQEKIGTMTALNQYKASTFLQRDRERYLRLLLANSPSIILFLNQSSRIEFCTDYFIAHAGFTSATDVQGHTAADILSPFLDAETQEVLLKHIHQAFAENVPLNFDARFHFDRDGPARDFAGLLVPMRDKQQRNNGIMLMFHDVTDIKQSREAALAASKAKSLFLSNMSHEIRTPMNAIIGMTSIGKQEKSPERKDYAFEKIETASAHLLGIINAVLDISKIEAGKMELSPIPFNFSQMLDRVLNVIMLRMQEKRQDFSITVDPGIPERVFGDDQHLAQIITNILSNAAKFTPEGGSVAFAATLLSREKDSCLIRLSVKDSGIGMSAQEQDKLFNIFQQAQSGTARKYGGSGLGLVISKRLLEMMGGDIRLESEPGQGACFFLTVPLGIPRPDRAAADGGRAAFAADSPDAYDFSGKTLLIVDDVAINLEIVSTLLESTGVAIDTAENGREAIEAFTADPDRYALILMDVQMPEIDGLQAAAMIRNLETSRAATVPIIAMTANVFKEDIQQCLDAGMNGHLGKPIALHEVLTVLARHLNTHA